METWSQTYGPAAFYARSSRLESPQLKKPGHVDIPKYNKTALDQAVRDRDAQFQRLVSTVQAGLLRHPQPTASDLNALLIQACEEIFPSQPKKSAVKAWESQPVRMRLQQFWQACRDFQKAKVNLALRGIMKVWLQYTHFQRSYKQLKREGRHARKQLLLNKLEEAQQASALGQVSRLYKVVRSIAPKTFQKAVRIHDENGCILSTGEEHGASMTYFQQLYAANAPAVHVHFFDVQDVFTEADVRLALSATQIGKAVPKGAAPSSSWKACSELGLGGCYILQIHNHCTYVIQHGPHVGRVNMMRGVKQGCTLAPLLWAIYSTYLAHLIGNATDYDGMLRCMTLYADDTHVHWSVSCTREMCSSYLSYLPGARHEG